MNVWLLPQQATRLQTLSSLSSRSPSLSRFPLLLSFFLAVPLISVLLQVLMQQYNFRSLISVESFFKVALECFLIFRVMLIRALQKIHKQTRRLVKQTPSFT